MNKTTALWQLADAACTQATDQRFPPAGGGIGVRKPGGGIMGGGRRPANPGGGADGGANLPGGGPEGGARPGGGPAGGGSGLACDAAPSKLPSPAAWWAMSRLGSVCSGVVCCIAVCSSPAQGRMEQGASSNRHPIHCLGLCCCGVQTPLNCCIHMQHTKSGSLCSGFHGCTAVLPSLQGEAEHRPKLTLSTASKPVMQCATLLFFCSQGIQMRLCGREGALCEAVLTSRDAA